jgi:hypothetical protein
VCCSSGASSEVINEPLLDLSEDPIVLQIDVDGARFAIPGDRDAQPIEIDDLTYAITCLGPLRRSQTFAAANASRRESEKLVALVVVSPGGTSREVLK